jgi:hypothetical protein
VSGPGDNASVLHAPNPPQSPLPTIGNASVVPPPPGGCPQDNGRHRGMNNDTDHDCDGANTLHKIEFPKFDDVGDPMSWLNHCEQVLRNTPKTTTPKSGTITSSSMVGSHHGIASSGLSTHTSACHSPRA